LPAASPRSIIKADAVVFWPLTVFEQGKRLADARVPPAFPELMLMLLPARFALSDLLPDAGSSTFGLDGLRLDSDQINGMASCGLILNRSFRPRSFSAAADEVLREERRKRNAFAKVCSYIAANPVGRS